MLQTRNETFIDESGREILLHGVNMVCKDQARNYIGEWTDADFKQLKSWGMNVIRFGIIWDGIEPNPGEYNEEYINRIRDLIRKANQYNLSVILDMHQDLFSKKFGNGAPAWATFTDDEEYAEGVVWSDAYLFNRAVHRSFDHFWNNTAASDNIGIQDHFVNAWGYVVNQLCSEPNIIGYDLFNEPFIGSNVDQVNEAMFSTFAKIYSDTYGKIDIEQLFEAWNHPEEKFQYLQLLNDEKNFTQLTTAPERVTQSFDEKILSSFFQKVTDAIREIDSNRIIFLETNYFSNLGVRSGIIPMKNLNNEKDPNQAYAPHAYDLVTDTEFSHLANEKRLAYIFNRHEETRARLQMPMLIGEWGAFYESNHTGNVSLRIQQLIENLLCSDTYWDYTPNMDAAKSFLGVRRAYPIATVGRLINYRYEHAVDYFEMVWEEQIESDEPTIVYLPNIEKLSEQKIFITPFDSEYSIHPITGSESGYIKIPPVVNGERSLIIT